MLSYNHHRKKTIISKFNLIETILKQANNRFALQHMQIVMHYDACMHSLSSGCTCTGKYRITLENRVSVWEASRKTKLVNNTSKNKAKLYFRARFRQGFMFRLENEYKAAQKFWPLNCKSKYFLKYGSILINVYIFCKEISRAFQNFLDYKNRLNGSKVLSWNVEAFRSLSMGK